MPYSLLSIIAGALIVAILNGIYRAIFDPSTRHVETLMREKAALTETVRSLRSANETLRALAIENGLDVPPVEEVSPSDAAIRAYIADGRKINAIKVYRETYGVGLKEAKDAVEAMIAAGTVRRPGPSAYATIAASPTDRITHLVQAGNKMAAIRDYRALTGVGLLEAKDHIDAIERQSNE